MGRNFVLFAAASLGACSGNLEEQVALDAEAQYKMVSDHGSATDQCVQAQYVSAAWLQAKNDAKYEQWKAIEKLDCAVAAIPT